MEYIHIKNLEKYHPGYTDRELKWGKIYFTIVQGDSEFELIDNEIDKWRFIAMVCLELEAKKPLPNIDTYWIKKFNLKKRSMSLTLQVLQNFTEVVTGEEQLPCIEKNKMYREEVKNKNYSGFEETILTLWNSFCEKHPTLTKIREVSDKRRQHLKKRFERESFRGFAKILAAILEQPFLMGENDRKWKLSFDWLIENDTNYLKVLELRYKDKIDKDIKTANPDCQICAGTGWDETEGKTVCRCRLRK